LENQEQENIYLALKKLYDESENKVEADAMVSRAYAKRVSDETIKEKVDAQLNAIRAGIKDINPKFKEGAKNYDQVKTMVTDTMSKYEQALKELSNFYDGKIEQLILRKVELEADYVGSILNEQYLKDVINIEKRLQENDGLKYKVAENITMAYERLKADRKDKREIDVRNLAHLVDGNELAFDVKEDLAKKVAKSENQKGNNEEFLTKIEKEISLIDAEIDRLNEQKKNAIYEAMEVGNRSISKNISKPKMFTKITRFFVSKFNAPKIIEASIIAPLRNRIDNFVSTDLSNMKG
jgi:hypothetical protein